MQDFHKDKGVIFFEVAKQKGKNGATFPTIECSL